MTKEPDILTVSELTRQIKNSLETKFPRIWVQGELSNFKQHTSGHLYFTIKDEGAQVSAVMWRSRVPYLGFSPEDGMKVVASGSITVYPPRGNYQIDVEKMQPLGVGELQIAFERLKQKLAAEGLFNAEHKKPVPEYPQSIGIVTSETGAALQDILSVIGRRNPSVDLLLYSVRVQGTGAAEEIAQAIKDVNRYGKVDVMIVGRGGGSLEDLWAFNEEIVARAIYESQIPIISAVGHEIDFSISDFVADLRAPTPSAAAEMAVRDRTEILEEIGNLCYTINNALKTLIDGAYNQLHQMISSYSFNKPRDLLREYSQRIDEYERSLGISLSHVSQIAHQRLSALHQQLEALNPHGVLMRGYTITRRKSEVVTSARLLQKNEEADIQFHDGTVGVRVEWESTPSEREQ